MKLFKQLALTALLTIGAVGAVVYTSCTKDKCKDVTCQNGGTCSGGTCTCAVGYEGTNCATKSRDKFVGTYTGAELCTVGSDNYTVVLTAASNDLQLTYTNLYNQALTATCNMVAVDSFAFTGTQSVSGTSVTFTGTGKLVSNTLTVHYTVNDGVTTNSCVYTGTK